MRYKANMFDKIQKIAALSLLKLPKSVQKILAGKQIQIDGKSMDTTVQFMAKYFLTETKESDLTPAKLRRSFDVQGNWLAPKFAKDVKIRKWNFKSFDGETINCEIYTPPNLPKQNAPALIFYHGGGYAAGSIESHRNVTLELARKVNCALVVVDYRLAPEFSFPIPINDCLSAFDAVLSSAQELGFDPKRISVAGDSAGGNAAAVVAQQRRGENSPKFQMLWVPWVDMSKESNSYKTMEKGFFLDALTMRWYTKQYIKNPEDAFNSLASPLLQEDLRGVCPAGILVAGFDPLSDEGVSYAKKLASFGVETHFHLIEGGMHPMINVAGKVPLAQEAFAMAVDILKANI